MKTTRILAMLLCVTLFVGCTKSTSTTTTALPLIVPLVEKAAPSGAAARSALIKSDRTTPEAGEALKDFFLDTWSNISGETHTGWVKAYLEDMDGRIGEVNTNDLPSCYSAASSTSIVFPVGTGNHTMTAKLGCAKKFNSSREMSGTGSGIAFGQDDTHTYIYLLLVQSNDTDKFGYVASINKTTEAVELLFLENFPSYNRVKFAHLRTVPASKTYEFSTASTGDGVGPTATNTAHILTAGARFVANETEIRAEGNVSASTNAAGTATPTAFAFLNTDCFDATDLSATPAACTSGAPSFATDMELVAATSLSGNTTIDSSLKTMEELIEAGVAETSATSP